MSFKNALIIMSVLGIVALPAQIYGTQKDIAQMIDDEENYTVNSVNSKVYQEKAETQEIQLRVLRDELERTTKELASRGEKAKSKRSIVQGLNEYMKGGKFTNKGETFYNAGNNNNVNPMLLAAISFFETRKWVDNKWVGGLSPVCQYYNNPSGINVLEGYPHKGRYAVFPDIETGINEFAKMLKRYYIDEGKTTIDTIGKKYCPTDDADNGKYGMRNEEWIPAVTRTYLEIYEIVKKINGGNL